MQFAPSGRITRFRSASRSADSSGAMIPSGRAPSLRRRRHADQENVGSTERIVSGIGGALLIIQGLRSRSFSGLIGGLVGAELVRRGITGHCMLYDQLGVNTAGRHESKAEDFFNRGIHVEESVTIQRPREEIFQFWRNFENLPRFMDHLKQVEVIDDKTSRWVAKAPIGYSVEWNAEIINEEPGSVIAWRSLLGADVDNRGAVRFRDAPQGRGTEVKVTLEYIPPAGRLGAAVAQLFGENPEWQIRDDLRRLREILETGEIATIEGQTSGRARRERSEQGWSRPAAMSDQLSEEAQSGLHRSDPGDHLRGGLEHTARDESALDKDAINAAAGPNQTGLRPDEPRPQSPPQSPSSEKLP